MTSDGFASNLYTDAWVGKSLWPLETMTTERETEQKKKEKKVGFVKKTREKVENGKRYKMVENVGKVK